MPGNAVLLVARILLAIIFILAGFGKFADIGPTAAMIDGRGLPMSMILAYLTAAFELVAGLAILAGFQTRIAAYLLASFCVVSGLLFHLGGEGQMAMINQIMLMKNLAMAGGFLALSTVGAGSWSVDRRTA